MVLNFFDLGQNQGNVSQMLINLADTLSMPYKLYGFEASSFWYNHCRNRFQNNTNVQCIHAAITNKIGPCKLYHSPNQVGHSIFLDKINVKKDDFEEVSGIVFSEWFRQIEWNGHINIMKANIEGAEYFLYNDLIDSGTFKNIHIFCGTLDDILKVPQLNVEDFKNKLNKYGINIHYFSDFQINRNVNLIDLIKKFL